jgi:hypothetical protein
MSTALFQNSPQPILFYNHRNYFCKVIPENMKIFKATRKYENWLQKEITVFPEDLALKEQKLKEDPSTFLRGTFYRWMQLFPEVCKKAADAPVVLSVGDLHAANFGTWRDAKGQLVWGVNDFDEAAPLPYTQDLIRLAASVELASEIEELKITLEEACEATLDGYRASLESNGKPIILDEEHEWLRQIYSQNEKSAEKFWNKLEQLPGMEAIPAEARIALEATFPSKGLAYRVKRRQAGVGSLGRPRYTALTEWQGERIARETKPLLPSAALWVEKKHKGAEIYYEEILARAVRSLDPVVKVYSGWVVRRLAPDSIRIELAELGPERDEKRMLHMMGWETGNIHLGTPTAVKDVLDDLKGRKKTGLRRRQGKWQKQLWMIGNGGNLYPSLRIMKVYSLSLMLSFETSNAQLLELFKQLVPFVTMKYSLGSGFHAQME